MPRRPNVERRIDELEQALLHLLEVQITPSTPHHDEWRAAVVDARRALRNRIAKGWKKMNLIEQYNLEESWREDMQVEYIGADG